MKVPPTFLATISQLSQVQLSPLQSSTREVQPSTTTEFGRQLRRKFSSSFISPASRTLQMFYPSTTVRWIFGPPSCLFSFGVGPLKDPRTNRARWSDDDERSVSPERQETKIACLSLFLHFKKALLHIWQHKEILRARQLHSGLQPPALITE